MHSDGPRAAIFSAVDVETYLAHWCALNRSKLQSRRTIRTSGRSGRSSRDNILRVRTRNILSLVPAMTDRRIKILIAAVIDGGIGGGAALFAAPYVVEVVVPAMTDRRLRKVLIAAGGIGGGAALFAAAPYIVLPALGFGAKGVVAGTAAALWQSYIGNVVAGSLFAGLQSAGAAGVAGTTALGLMGAGAATGGAAVGIAGATRGGGGGGSNVAETAGATRGGGGGGSNENVAETAGATRGGGGGGDGSSNENVAETAGRTGACRDIVSKTGITENNSTSCKLNLNRRLCCKL